MGSAAARRAPLSVSGRSVSMQNISNDLDDSSNRGLGFSGRFSNANNLSIPSQCSMDKRFDEYSPKRQRLLRLVNLPQPTWIIDFFEPTRVWSWHSSHQWILHSECSLSNHNGSNLGTHLINGFYTVRSLRTIGFINKEKVYKRMLMMILYHNIFS